MTRLPFSSEVDEVLKLAKEDAIKRNHEYVGTEHMLVGLVEQPWGIGSLILKDFGINLSQIKEHVDRLTQPGPEKVFKETLPMTPRAKSVIQKADILAVDDPSYSAIGTKHLLLGLVKEDQGIASGILDLLGVTEKKINKFLKEWKDPEEIVEDCKKLNKTSKQEIFENPAYHVVENTNGMYDIIEFEKEYPEDGHMFLAMTPNKTSAQFIVDKLNANS